MSVRVKPRRYWRHPTAGPVPDTIPGVDARVNFITLAVADVAASRRFYVEGLGWPPSFEEPGEVIYFRVSPTLILALWSAAAFEGEVGAITRRDGHPPFTLAHNVPAQEQVDIVLATAAAAGATVLEAGTPREWGGYTGYFTHLGDGGEELRGDLLPHLRRGVQRPGERRILDHRDPVFLGQRADAERRRAPGGCRVLPHCIRTRVQHSGRPRL